MSKERDTYYRMGFKSSTASWANDYRTWEDLTKHVKRLEGEEHLYGVELSITQRPSWELKEKAELVRLKKKYEDES